jgi:ribosomal protein S18 acetylase RimI-like enzyme
MPTFHLRALEAADLEVLFGPRDRAFGEAWLKRQTQGEVYVAVCELDGIPVGRCGLDFVRQPGRADIWAAHVEPDHQSQGVGTALLQHLEAVARQRGFGRLQLGVGKENPRAQRLYERLGYAVCGEEVARWRYPDGERLVEVAEDCWLMQKTV